MSHHLLIIMQLEISSFTSLVDRSKYYIFPAVFLFFRSICSMSISQLYDLHTYIASHIELH